MSTLLIGTLERTVGWFHPGGHRSAGSDGLPDASSAPAPRTVPFELRLRQWFCRAARGHEFLRGIDGRRMYLICQHCFHETPGWEVAEQTPRMRG